MTSLVRSITSVYKDMVHLRRWSIWVLMSLVLISLVLMRLNRLFLLSSNMYLIWDLGFLNDLHHDDLYFGLDFMRLGFVTIFSEIGYVNKLQIYIPLMINVTWTIWQQPDNAPSHWPKNHIQYMTWNRLRGLGPERFKRFSLAYTGALSTSVDTTWENQLS